MVCLLAYKSCQSVRVRGRPGRIYVYATRGACVFLLSSFSSFCLFSALVRTDGCLSPSPSLHVGFFFSSLVIHILLLSVSSCRSVKGALSRYSVIFLSIFAAEKWRRSHRGRTRSDQSRRRPGKNPSIAIARLRLRERE